MKFSDLREGDIVMLDYYDKPDEPMRLYTWLSSKHQSGYGFYATDLWASLGTEYLDDDWHFTDSRDNITILSIIANVRSPLKMLQELHPELFI